MTFIIVDVEADGPIPAEFSMVCFGAARVDEQLDATFYALRPSTSLPLQLAPHHAPTCNFSSQFGWPVFLGSGHEYLPVRLVRLLKERQESTAALEIKLAHDVVDQKHRWPAMNKREVLRLRHLKGHRKRALLAFAGKLRRRPVIQ